MKPTILQQSPMGLQSVTSGPQIWFPNPETSIALKALITLWSTLVTKSLLSGDEATVFLTWQNRHELVAFWSGAGSHVENLAHMPWGSSEVQDDTDSDSHIGERLRQGTRGLYSMLIALQTQNRPQSPQLEGVAKVRRQGSSTSLWLVDAFIPGSHLL